MKDVQALLPYIVGPFERHCSSCGLLPTAAYVTAPLIGIGVTPLSCSHSGSQMLDHIIAFDRAEAEQANLTQTNLVTVSSFNGLCGLLLGYDLLRQPLCPHPFVSLPHVLDAAPLFRATQALFGTVEQPRFPIAPGQHILCASKTLYRNGPCVLYGALAVGIAEHRDRNADLFMEDLGTLEETGQEPLILKSLIDAVGKIGDNLSVRYSSIFVGLRTRAVKMGEVGCVLTAAPYIHLAQKAVPSGNPSQLVHIPLKERMDSKRKCVTIPIECAP